MDDPSGVGPVVRSTLSAGSVQDAVGQGGAAFMDMVSEPDNDAVLKVMKKKASKRSSAGSSLCGEVDGELLIIHTPDGRLCRLCHEADNSKDPVTGKGRKWFRQPKNGHTQGAMCWYCGRVWFSMFRVRFKTLTEFILAAGQSQELLEERRQGVAFLIKTCVGAGTHDVTMQWGCALSSEVSSIERLRSQVIDDDGERVGLEYYKTLYRGGLGDPATNGLGHRTGWFEGIYGVFVPGAP